jgi:SAM-dependent methyltransferase
LSVNTLIEVFREVVFPWGEGMSDVSRWNQRYEKGDTPWDTGQPSSELQRVVAELALRPCRALELGCGTGANAVWLAQQGFDVTALDLSNWAVERARQRVHNLQERFLGQSCRRPIRTALSPPNGRHTAAKSGACWRKGKKGNMP